MYIMELEMYVTRKKLSLITAEEKLFEDSVKRKKI